MSHDMRKSVFIVRQRQMCRIDHHAIQQSLLGTFFNQFPESTIASKKFNSLPTG